MYYGQVLKLTLCYRWTIASIWQPNQTSLQFLQNNKPILTRLSWYGCTSTYNSEMSICHWYNTSSDWCWIWPILSVHNCKKISAVGFLLSVNHQSFSFSFIFWPSMWVCFTSALRAKKLCCLSRREHLSGVVQKFAYVIFEVMRLPPFHELMDVQCLFGKTKFCTCYNFWRVCLSEVGNMLKRTHFASPWVYKLLLMGRYKNLCSKYPFPVLYAAPAAVLWIPSKHGSILKR